MEPASFSTKLIAFLSAFSGGTAYAVILGLLLICGLGVPIPEDITLIAAGILSGLTGGGDTGGMADDLKDKATDAIKDKLGGLGGLLG